MANIVAAFPTLVFQILDNSIVMRIASEQETGLKEVLRAHLGETVVPSSEAYTRKVTDRSATVTWRDGALRLTHEPLEAGVHRYDILWTAGKVSKLTDSIQLGGARWYGGAEVRKMAWPTDGIRFKMAPFVAGDSYKDGEYGGVQERYWLSSLGVGVFVRPEVPLFVAMNESGDGALRLTAKYEAPYRNNTGSYLQLRYSIYHGPDIMTTHRAVRSEAIPRPVDVPDLTMFALPVWSTWAICKEDVDQRKVLLLANQIKYYGIETAHLVIEDHWASHRGDWTWNRDKFPNPNEMIRRLGEFGFRVTIWVHPFANLKSDAIKRSELFVKGAAKGAVRWWNGIGRLLDITKPEAVEWYRKELDQLRENYGLKSFKFDGGEATWLPKKWRLAKACNNPNMYTKKYAEFAYEMDKEWRSVEVRVGVRTQRLPIFVRMTDKDSVWHEKNGLRSLIPHALLYGLIGFPFFIPDVVGGNAYDADRPTKSLFIRWLQLCTLMPCIQFSLPPWWFDSQTVRITKKMLALRAKHADLLIDLARRATQTGDPIIRPLWWIAPEDDFALKCDDQFLVGDDLLVAPVLTKDATTRPLYLPAGRWRDEKTGHILEGNKWYFQYQVTLEDLPHFTRQKEPPTVLVDISEDKTVPLSPVVLHQTSAEAEDREKTASEDASQTEDKEPEETVEATPSEQPDKPAADESDSPETAASGGNGSDVTDQSVPRTESPADVDVDDEEESLARGKYRFSRLDEDINEELVAQLSDLAGSVDSLDIVEETTDRQAEDSDEDFRVKDISEIMTYLRQEVTEQTEDKQSEDKQSEDKQSEDKKAPLAKQESLTDELDVCVTVDHAAGSTAVMPPKSEDNIDSKIPNTENEGESLESLIPAPLSAKAEAKTTQEKGVVWYENLPRETTRDTATKPETEQAQTDLASAPPIPARVPMSRGKTPRRDEERKSTLWDELTAKLKDMPKFDPDFDFCTDKTKSVGIQTSFGETEMKMLPKQTVTIATQTSPDDFEQ